MGMNMPSGPAPVGPAPVGPAPVGAYQPGGGGGMAEGEVWAGEPFRTQKNRRIALLIAGVIFFLLPGIYLASITVTSCNNIDCSSTSTSNPFLAFGAIWAIIGVVMILVGVLSILKPKAKVRYVLTNRRAIVYSVQKGNQNVMQQCDLPRSTISVLNRQVVSQTKSRGGMVGGGGLVGMAMMGAGVGTSSSVGQSNQVGDVVFMVGGVPQVRFVGVSDPDGILATAQSILASTRGA